MGPHKEPVVRETPTIKFAAMREHQDRVMSQWKGSAALRDPYDVLCAKIEHLSQILGCTEAVAERVLFQRLAAYEIEDLS